MNGLKYIKKIREYCDYVEDHLIKVGESWRIVQKHCGDVHPIYDDNLRSIIDGMVLKHDLSKLSPEEFIQYQRQFFPVSESSRPPKNDPAFAAAWEHHKAENPHHWENWSKITMEQFPNELSCHVVCMVCDWLAMAMAFNETKVDEYYLKNKSKMNLPPWACDLIEDIYSRLRPLNILAMKEARKWNERKNTDIRRRKTADSTRRNSGYEMPHDN